MPHKGLYILVLFLEENQTIAAGRLPHTDFESGIYLYVGRAKKNLSARLRRHLKKEKKLFWHIDYFLQKVPIKEIWIKPDVYDECHTALHIKNMIPGCRFAQKKFGASDCHCYSHLLYCPQGKPELSIYLNKIGFKEVRIHGNQI